MATQSGTGAAGAGAAYVFVRDGTNWTQQAYLKPSNTGFGGMQFGSAVAAAGDTLVVGAEKENRIATGINGDQATQGAPESGAVYIFARSVTNWQPGGLHKAVQHAGCDSIWHRSGDFRRYGGRRVAGRKKRGQGG